MIIIAGMIFCAILNNYEIVNKFVSAISPFIIGCILALILNIPLSFIEKNIFKKHHNKITRTCSIIMSFSIIILLVYLILKLLVPQTITIIEKATNNIPTTIEDIKQYCEDKNIKDKVLSSLEENEDQIRSNIDNAIKSFMEFSKTWLQATIRKIIDVVVGIIIAINVLFYKESIKSKILDFNKAILSDENSKKINDILILSDETFHNFVKGQILEAIILGTLCILGMLILRIPYAFVIGFLTMIAALIPILGAWGSGIIGFLLILTNNPVKAIVFAIFIITLQFIEGNVIYPKVVGSAIKMPGILVLFVVMVCGKLFGINGIILGIPLASVIHTIIGNKVNSKLEDIKE